MSQAAPFDSFENIAVSQTEIYKIVRIVKHVVEMLPDKRPFVLNRESNKLGAVVHDADIMATPINIVSIGLAQVVKERLSRLQCSAEYTNLRDHFIGSPTFA